MAAGRLRPSLVLSVAFRPPEHGGSPGLDRYLDWVDPAENLVIVYLTTKINSPLPTRDVPQPVDGNWYTASTLGFVANILYQGLTPQR